MDRNGLPIQAGGTEILNLNICLVTFSIVFVGLRLYIRLLMTKTAGLDDLFSVLSWALLTTLSGLEISEVFNGLGQQIKDVKPENLDRFFGTLPTMQLLYFSSTMFVRLAVVAFLPRLNKEKRFKIIVYILGSCIIIYSGVAFCIMLFECSYVPDLWNKQNPTAHCLPPAKEAQLMYAHGAISIFFDLVLFIVPAWTIYSKMLWSTKTIKVIIIFSVALFVIITGIIRLSIIVTVDMATNTTFNIPRASLWTDLEGHVGLWVACFPTLQPLLRLISFKMGFTSNLISGSKKKSNATWPGKKSGYVISGSHSNSKIRKGSQNEDSVFDYGGSNKDLVYADSHRMDDLRKEGTSGARIMKTTDIEVRRDEGAWDSHPVKDRSWIAV